MKTLLVLWRITEHCNASCEFCGFSSQIKKPRISVDSSQVLRFGEILSSYSKASGRPVMISWLGGEPLLWPDICQVSEYVNRDLGISLSLTTNGLLLSVPEFRNMLLKYYAELVVSIDGLPDFHNQVRGRSGLLKTICNNIALLRGDPGFHGSGIKLHTNTILMRDNIAQFEELCCQLADHGFNSLTFNQLGGVSRPEFFANQQLSTEQFDLFIQRLPSIRKKMNDRNFVIKGNEQYLNRISASTAGMKIPIEDCRPGEDFLIISEQGRISACTATSKEAGVDISQMTEANMLEMLPGQLRSLITACRPGQCLDCHSTQFFGKFADPDIFSYKQ